MIADTAITTSLRKPFHTFLFKRGTDEVFRKPPCQCAHRACERLEEFEAAGKFVAGDVTDDQGTQVAHFEAEPGWY